MQRRKIMWEEMRVGCLYRADDPDLSRKCESFSQTAISQQRGAKAQFWYLWRPLMEPVFGHTSLTV